MYIKKIDIKNFRNYDELSLSFDKNVNIIVGNNAQGKTNLLEAIFLSSIGRSFRTSHDSEMIGFGKDSAFVRVEAEKDLVSTKVEINIESNKRKYIKKDGKKIRKTSELIDNITIVVFSPEDLEIVKDEPEKRRRFIDRELSQIKPAYYDSLDNYKKTLLQRNAYLKEEKVERSLLDMWDEQLSLYGSELIIMREEFTGILSGFSSSIHSSITDGREKLVIKYVPNIPLCERTEEQRRIFKDILEKSFENDIRQRTTTRGPHKDDINFFIDDINVRNFGSQGQQRTCALSLKLAELDFIKEETGEKGILLLDDVMSELDEDRRKFLVKTLRENQLFITTTDIGPEIMEPYPDAEVIRIKKGRVIY